jgi:hypothetical protein
LSLERGAQAIQRFGSCIWDAIRKLNSADGSPTNPREVGQVLARNTEQSPSRTDLAS